MSTQPFFTRDRLLMMALLILSALVYLPALGGLPILDDHMISSGAAIGGGKSLRDCFTEPFLFHYFRPLVSASFWLEMRFHGANPFLLHQTNIVIHVITTYLIVVLAQSCGLSRKAALLGGLFFAIQPAQVGAVAWIGGRTDSQACLFFVLMMIGVAKFYQGGKWWWVAVGVLSAWAALLTKEQVLPAVLLAPLAGFAFGASRRRIFWSAVPFAATTVSFLALFLLGSPEIAKGPTVPAAEIASQISRSTLNYALLLGAPNPWSMHTFSLEILRSPLWLALGAALTIAIPYGIYRLWKFDARLAWVAVGGALVYFPVSNIIPIPSLLAAPYRVALCGPAAAILLGFAASRIKVQKVPAVLAYAGAAASLFLVPWGSARHANETTLFAACVKYDPSSFYMRGNYLTALQSQGRYSEALDQSDNLLSQVFATADTHDYQALEKEFKADKKVARRILDNNGARAEAGPLASRYVLMRGQVLTKMDRNEEALRALATSARLDPKSDAAYFGMGQLLLDSNDRLAVRYLQRATVLNPENGGAIYALGRYYMSHKDYEAAYRTLNRMLRVPHDTSDPLLDLADVEIRTGRTAEAKRALYLASRGIVDVTRLNQLIDRAGS
ncbi:hypothetical protein [Fimbriimonas ginsengisoli]|uniref:Uncharacterized protein n=1 Tax=Fimbriimonas ginsengisoli Gsoil 348 TaxID=661478 RepID=A0A068NWG5_FIMGI|nr:hypothetical protein [Fimbriimonas ginsengisoli]AIE87796.1 hypothetical protein OP10G_4428 [Fimbriimonas ginsengisoli Gsoil 348]